MYNKTRGPKFGIGAYRPNSQKLKTKSKIVTKWILHFSIS